MVLHDSWTTDVQKGQWTVRVFCNDQILKEDWLDLKLNS